MAFSPDYESFATAYDAGQPQILSTRLVADLETPVSAMLKLARNARYSFLLESVEGGAVRGRYSIIGMNPDLIWKVEGGKAAINRKALADDKQGFTPLDQHPLLSLRALLQESRIDFGHDAPPMAAGVFGYLGYDMVRLMEDLPSPKPDTMHVPDGMMIRPTVMAIFDSVKDEVTVTAPVYLDPAVSARAAYARASERIQEVVDALDRPLDMALREADTLPIAPSASNTPPERYREMVLAAKEYIAAGDIFQVVLSQRFESDFSLPPFSLYRALRRVNPSPFLYYLDFDSFAVVGSSPEILVRVRDGKVSIRPIAGTRRRGATPTEDQALAEELLADPKERAEHLMLLDLGRNDVGRVAEIGSVKVTDKFILEFYSQVMHIVSNVEGKLDKKHDLIDALVAGFPAGTVSGAPKVRAMEIIDEMEVNKRGIYGGCVGYFGANGEMDTCIVLRTAIVKDGKMFVQAGAGIVADSVPESELQECVNKAKALFRAAEEAVRFAGRAGRGQ
ncbi:anthranilate synthase component I [Aestuariivirga litoralis]|uniref:anthranilate synthase component I n=1 Tax=Aestuariivirga litoralis TaxID=2650924 RepID=UPI0018C6901C|nr:anthranilate synthase component I [Aestuariivirga litoralis]MBG1231659.1 anthranilate synthase component I [Aestuariivirga litoralis]